MPAFKKKSITLENVSKKSKCQVYLVAIYYEFSRVSKTPNHDYVTEV
jgi:hypothetical protein